MSDGVFRRALTRNALALVFACLVPGASIAAEVEVFSPEGSVKGVRQVLVRFSTPMVTFGDPRLEDPALADCPVAGSGRWADQRNWVYDFEEDLPGGLACAFTLTEGLTDLEGAPIMGPREFSFDTGSTSGW